MTIAAVVPALQTVGALASLAGTVVSAISGSSQSAASTHAAGADSAKALDQMQGLLRRQQETQLQTMEMQTQANIQKMLADTANSIASGHLDSGNKVQNAVHKAAQGIQF
ncbi:hypothetical protein C9I57_29330 [Trinickia symbiotica]|uniref:Type III secretion protein n=1 Tax=Trinickia symbiotica TaxID=863227 RepID=A0A2T3XKX7_9BURK|nr:hypothetical protein [Trinickia symbiotica]PTB17178.1 hypothetical protein C9I57_29330 [Trinickia symbiotica]